MAKEKGIKISEIEEDDTDTEENKPVLEFQTLINKSQEQIKNIEKQIYKLIPIKTQIIDVTDDEEKEITKNLNIIVDNINDSKIKMDRIIKELKSHLIHDETNKDDDDLRIKKNLFDAMIKKYQRTLERFQDTESQIKKIKETKLVRGAEIVLGQELDEKERKKVIENPEMVQQIYENKLKKKAHVRLVNAVKDLENRHKDIKNLEKSILDLHKMIIELNLLVQYQGEMIDNIVENVSLSKTYIIKGEKEIDKAKKNSECKIY